MLRINETPKIEVHVVNSGEAPGGIGEAGAMAGRRRCATRSSPQPAVALRRLPIDRTSGWGEEGMSGKMRILQSLVVIAIVVAALGVWIIRGPGPLDFAGGTKVALADYRAGKPTGVPAKLEKASVVERGEYLAKAADCMVCHTKPGREGIFRRARLQAAVRHALFDQHHAGQGHRHRQLQRPGFPQRGPARRAS